MKTSPETANSGTAPPERANDATAPEPVGANGPPGQVSDAMPQDVKRLLVELARAMQRQSLYPRNHPALRGTSDALSELVANIAGGGEFVIQVGREHLGVDGHLMEVDSPALAALADHLHRHRVAALSLSGEVGSVEVEELLAALARDPSGHTDSPLAETDWPHVRVVLVHYDRLVLDETGLAELPPDELGGVWLALAESALVEGATPDEAADAARLARNIEAHCANEDYARDVTRHLLEVEQMIESSPERTGGLRDLTSDLVSRIDPDALRQLLDVGTNIQERRELLAGACSTLGAGAVVKLLREVAELERCEIPRAVWLVLTKLARYAEQGPPERRQQAAKLVRDQVGQLLADWEISGYAPEDYASVLEAMSAEETVSTRSGGGRSRARVEPRRVVEMGIEVEEISGYVDEAFTRMVDDRDVGALLDILEEAPVENPAVAELRRRLNPEVLGSLLAEESIDFVVVDRLVDLLGDAAAPPLLDSLADSESRGTRSQLLRRLVGLGSAIAPIVAERVDDERWYVRRNMLSLLGDLEAAPEGFSAARFMEDENESVRLAAIKLALNEPGERHRAIAAALGCNDSRTVIMGLIEARDELPNDQVGRIVELALNEHNSREVRMHATRTLAEARSDEALEALLDLARAEKGWWVFRRSDGNSAIQVEAVSALRCAWADDPRAAKVLGSQRISRLLRES